MENATLLGHLSRRPWLKHVKVQAKQLEEAFSSLQKEKRALSCFKADETKKQLRLEGAIARR